VQRGSVTKDWTLSRFFRAKFCYRPLHGYLHRGDDEFAVSAISIRSLYLVSCGYDIAIMQPRAMVASESLTEHR
jgi:hypothetical protein